MNKKELYQKLIRFVEDLDHPQLILLNNLIKDNIGEFSKVAMKRSNSTADSSDYSTRTKIQESGFTSEVWEDNY